MHATNNTQGGAASPFNITPGHLDHYVWTTSFASTRTAGVPFSVSATAYDAYDNVKTDYTGTGATLTSNLGPSPTTSPTVPGNLNWGPGTGIGTASITPTNATHTDASAGQSQHLTISDGSVAATTSPDFAVDPNIVKTVTFGGPAITYGQPVDTQVNTPIYSICAPPPALSTKPCADLTGTAPSSAVTVYAVDNWGNPILSTTNNIKITAAPNALVGVTQFASTLLGYASFGTQLSELGTGTGIQLTAKAVANPSVATVDSIKFRIVTTLKGCTGASCINKALGNASSKSYVNSWSQINTTGCFYCAGVNVLQSTQLVTTSTASQCGNTVWVSDIADQRVTGTNTQVTSTGLELIVIPKNTLKSSGVLNRGPLNFNICFGAIWIGPTPAVGTYPTPWNGKTSATNTAKKPATRVDDPTVQPLGYRFYGIPADCGTSYLTPADPCIYLRTKQKSAIQAALGTDAASIMNDSDLGIILRVGARINNVTYASPWDGGSHPF